MRIFATPAREFRLTEIRVQPDIPYHEPGRGSIALMILIEGQARIETPGSTILGKGDSVMIPASTGACTIRGPLHLYGADVPL